MGIPTDPDDNGYEAGDDCIHCWGVGKPFGDVPTPKAVIATFANVIACPGEWAPDGNYTLTQLPPPDSCEWRMVINGVTFRWRVPHTQACLLEVFKTGPPLKKYFIATRVACGLNYTNLYTACTVERKAWGGTGVIS